MASNTLSNIGNLMSGIGQGIAAGVSLFNDYDLRNKISQAKALGAAKGMTPYSTGNFDTLNSQWGGLNKTNYERRDLFNPSGKDVFFGMLNAGIQGANIGQQIGSSIDSLIGNNSTNIDINNVDDSGLEPINEDAEFANGGAIGMGVGAAFFQGLKGIDYLHQRNVAKQEAENINASNDYYNAMMTHNYANANQNTYNMLFNQKMMGLAEGGPLFSNGINWNSALDKVNTGGTHEENPNDGVQVGEANGVAQKVEQGETIRTKDSGERFVFSNRILAKKEFLEEANLPIKYAGKSYSEISENYKDDVNDPISKRGNNEMLDRLEYAQEAQKLAEEEEEMQEEVQPSLEDMNILNQMQAMQNAEQLPQEQMQPSEEEMMQQQMMQQMIGNPQQMPTQFARGGKLYPNGGPQTVLINGRVVPFNLIRDSYGALARDASTMGYDVVDENVAKAYIDRDGKIRINLNKDFDTTGLKGVANTIEFNSLDEYKDFLKGVENQWNIYGASSSNPLGRAIYSKDGKYVDIPDGDFSEDKYTFTGFDAASGKNLYTPKPVEEEPEELPIYSTAGRTAPIMQSLAALLTNAAMSPDETYPKALEALANEERPVNVHPIGSSYRYEEQPINYIANEIASNNQGLSRMLLDAASGNRLAVLPALLEARTKANSSIGEAFTKGFEANNNARNQIAQLRATDDKFNSQAASQADYLNSQINSRRLSQLASAAKIREDIYNLPMQAISAASQATANNFARMADENFAMNNVNRSGMPYGYDADKLVSYTKRSLGGLLDSDVIKNIKRNKR